MRYYFHYGTKSPKYGKWVEKQKQKRKNNNNCAVKRRKNIVKKNQFDLC